MYQGLQSPILLEGDTPELGDFEIQIVDGMSKYGWTRTWLI